MSIAANASDEGRTAVSATRFSSAWCFRKELEATPKQTGGGPQLIFEGISETSFRL
ncbi:MAG: hypothetical protein WBW41_01590 [Verrucomicrobiia bacterium]